MALSGRHATDLEDAGWRFGFKLTTDHVWDAWAIFCLLEDRTARDVHLELPHTGEQKDRLQAAMQEQNERIIRFGQPELLHYCDRCTRIYKKVDADGNVTYGVCQPIVSDGITLGRPCCGVFRCTDPLLNNRHRFCGQHDDKHYQCAIIGCDSPISKGKVCADPQHRRMEELRDAKGRSAFSLKERLQRAQVSHQNDSMAAEPEQAQEDVEENVVWFEVDERTAAVELFVAEDPGCIGIRDDGPDTPLEPCGTKPDTGNRKFKAQFARRRTHSEQTMVRCCGVIVAISTFYGAEAVSNVLQMMKQVFTVPGARKPEHLIYDTACDVKRQAESQGDPWFSDVGMCVDVWHLLNKHKTTHEYCQLHCNPADYPELLSENGESWYFNTSIAEQVNVWLGGFHSICREMLPVKYEFFLHEMIRRRNILTVDKLRAQGYHPQ
ncbi:hypothetical protein FIBSPDRAFT_664129, partial [Athelia psychrophila]